MSVRASSATSFPSNSMPHNRTIFAVEPIQQQPQQAMISNAILKPTSLSELREIAAPLLDMKLIQRTIDQWTRPLPSSYISRPLVVVGPSGVGKGRLIRSLLRDYSRFFQKIVTHTTRRRRPEEVNGTSYHFVSHDDFQRLNLSQYFIESAIVHQNCYGLSREAWAVVTRQNKISIMEIDIQGAQTIHRLEKTLHIRPYYLFIAPDTIDRLRQRLIKRGAENEYEIELRIQDAIWELEVLKNATFFDAIVVNEELEPASRQFFRLVRDWYPAIPSAARIRMLQRRIKNIKELANGQSVGPSHPQTSSSILMTGMDREEEDEERLQVDENDEAEDRDCFTSSETLNTS